MIRNAWARFSARGGLLRNAIAGAVATAADFASVVAMVELIGISPPVATFAGCVIGGIVNFFVNRLWAFRTDLPYAQQALRYGVVSGLSALYNAVLVAVLLLIWPASYRFAWGFARAAVFLAWNYPMHRHFVFTTRSVVE